MKSSNRSRLFTSTGLLAVAVGFALAAPPLRGSDDWAQYRGPQATGEAPAETLPEGAFGLVSAWDVELGSGYSNVSIAGDRAVALFTRGEVDLVGAFELASGEELWSYELGPKYAGHDGSDDGPLSTPAIEGDAVYVLGPTGQFVAVGLADGREIWRRQLDESNSTLPFYGYTSSPLVVGDRVILATGGENGAVVAFDAASGEPVWSAGEDSVTYQTPIVAELDGRRTLVAVTDQMIHGIDPESGEVLWQHRHSEGETKEESAQATPIDGERFLVDYNRGTKMYRVADGTVEELWESRAFGNSLGLPVRVGDHLYGFTGRFLTCADLKTGEIVWRSRPPGGFGLSLVGGALAILNRDGDLVLVDPSPEGYREVTRAPVFEIGDYAVPSLAEGLFVVRNLERMAAVRADPAAAPQTAETDDEDRLAGAFGEWVAEVEARPESERQALVDERFAGLDQTPVLGEDGWVHFVWRGEATDVGLVNDTLPGGELGMYRVAGTDLFFRSAELDPNGQYTYGFTVDFEAAVQDPRNPHTVDNGFNVVSELRMPGWPDSPHLDEPAADAPRGELDRFPFHSEILDNTRELQVWRPPGYSQDTASRYPVLVVNHGDNLLRGGLMRNTLDNLVGKSVAPLIAVFVPRLAGPEYGGPHADEYNRFLIEELLPHLDRHYRTDPSNRAIMGPGSAGAAALYAAFSRPDVFSRAAAQSYYPIPPSDERLAELIASSETQPEQIYLAWSRRDYELGEGRSAETASRELAEQIEAAGVVVTRQISDYSPGWGGWRGQHDDLLAVLFPHSP